MTISATTQGLRPGVCTSTSRPSAPFDGMMIYETDTNLVRIWNGTAWKTLAYSDYTNGSVLQVVSTTKTDTFTATTGTTPTDITGLSVTISPSTTSNLVLVIAQIAAGLNTSGGFILVRGSTSIGVGATAGSRRLVTTGYNQNPSAANQGFGSHNIMFLDSPATTSATTYKIQATGDQAGSVIYVNRGATDTDNTTHMRAASTITVMEIAG